MLGKFWDLNVGAGQVLGLDVGVKQAFVDVCQVLDFDVGAFDDMLVYSKTFCDHLNHLTKAFQVLLDGQFFLKLSKFSFAQFQVKYLGHVVLTKEVEPVPAKVHAIQ